MIKQSKSEKLNKAQKKEKKRLAKLAKKEAKFYVIDAYSVANELGLKNKISTILETCILDIIGYSNYIDNIKDSIKKRFIKKF